MTASLLATKLYMPSLPARRVARPRLAQRLDEGLAAGRRLTLVSAPAGFGKTTCVIDWLSGLDLPVSWLSLDAADDDPARFFAYLAAALHGAPASAGLAPTSAAGAGETAITALLNGIAAAPRRMVLVLDDFHTIRDAAILKLLERLIANQPANLHLVLVTREDPPLPLARLRANNQMTEVRAADLRFTDQEAGDFLNGLMGLTLSAADVAALEDRTEGWVAGLQLAALSMRGRADSSTFVAGLSGSHHYILSYLTEEVLDRQTPDIRDFLLQTSILDRLNGDLCAAVVESKPTQGTRLQCETLLRRLCAANLFLVPLDDDGRWYRYHHLFAHLLNTRLRQTLPPEGIQALHRRAGDWLAQHDFVDEAIAHALAAHDFEHAIALVEPVARTMIYTGRMTTLRNWLAAFPAACDADHPRLAVYRTWIDLLQGKLDFSEATLQQREDLLRSLPPSPENDRLRAELAVILCRYSPVFGNTGRTIRLAQEALRAVPDTDLVARARLIFALGVAQSLEERVAEAEAAFAESLRLARAADDNGLAAEILDLMAQERVHHGLLHAAAACYQELIELGHAAHDTRPDLAGPAYDGSADIESGPASRPPFYAAGAGYLGLAGIYLEQYELARAEECLARGVDLCTAGGLDSIYTAYGIRSRLRQCRGDLAGALEELAALERAFHRGDDPAKAARRISIACAQGDLAAAARAVEPWLKLLALDPAQPRPPRAVLEIAILLAARVCLAQGDRKRGLAMLEDLLSTAVPGGRNSLVIQANLLKAIAWQPEDERRARAALGQALAPAAAEGYVLLFLEQGPELVPLLQAVADDRSVPPVLRRHAARLLADFAGLAGDGPAIAATAAEGRAVEATSAPATEPAPVEPLTERELEILRLIGDGCTNQEIAGRLVITLHTVKKHSSNIFGKLGVTSRTQALARAHRLGLL